MIDDIFQKVSENCNLVFHGFHGMIERRRRRRNNCGNSWKYKRLQLVCLYPEDDRREFWEGTREVKRGAKFRRRVASTNERPGLNQSLLHLGAPWQNSILSRRLPTLNFDTLRSHQASQHQAERACRLRDTGEGDETQGCKLSYPVATETRYEANAAWLCAGSTSLDVNLLLADNLPVNLNPRGS